MLNAAAKTLSGEIAVSLINSQGRPEQMKFRFASEDGGVVSASELKQNFLSWFDESAVAVEAEDETDENRSYHLLAFDENGKRHTIPDDATIDLNCFNQFEISPRTTGGVEKAG